MDSALTRRTETYLGRVLELEDFRVLSAEEISGNGQSRTVVKLTTEAGVEARSQDFVVLFEQPSSPVIPNRDAEFGVLRALSAHSTIKVPQAYWVESDPEPMGGPFLLTGFLPGTTNPKKLLAPPLQSNARCLILESFTVLGQLAALEVEPLDLGPAFAVPKPGEAWRVELDRCEKIISDCRCADEVVTSAALRFLHRFPPPPPAKLSIVHGDYRLGNYLFDSSGITGIIDWEMVHLGDAMEDLAWSLLPLWEYADHPGRPGGVLTRAEAIGAWELTSGRRVDPAALLWWSVFCHVKAISIWATARNMFETDERSGIVPGLIGYALIQQDEAQIAQLLSGRPL